MLRANVLPSSRVLRAADITDDVTGDLLLVQSTCTNLCMMVLFPKNRAKNHSVYQKKNPGVARSETYMGRAEVDVVDDAVAWVARKYGPVVVGEDDDSGYDSECRMRHRRVTAKCTKDDDSDEDVFTVRVCGVERMPPRRRVNNAKCITRDSAPPMHSTTTVVHGTPSMTREQVPQALWACMTRWFENISTIHDLATRLVWLDPSRCSTVEAAYTWIKQMTDDESNLHRWICSVDVDAITMR